MMTAQEEHEAHWAMRERAAITRDSLMGDKMRYRKALLLACGGDEEKARQFLDAAAGVQACDVDRFTSRVCERGTFGCTVAHGVKVCAHQKPSPSDTHEV